MAVGGSATFKEKAAILSGAASREDVSLMLPDYDPQKPSFDLTIVISSITQCNLVLADLSDERPSCYFELGLAEALRRPIALVAERGTRIHQTSYRHQVQYYGSIAEYAATVEKILSEAGVDKASR